MLLYIIRHGETDGNREGILQGRLDLPLNEKGRELARITGQGLKDIHFDMAVTSPLKRADETARIILENNAFPGTPLIYDERIMEISFGEWEGHHIRGDVDVLPKREYQEFYEHPFTFKNGPGGESIPALCERTGAFYRELTGREDLKDKTVLISTHGCALRALMHQVYEDKSSFWHGKVPDNCAVSIVSVENGQSRLLSDDKIYYDRSEGTNLFRSERMG